MKNTYLSSKMVIIHAFCTRGFRKTLVKFGSIPIFKPIWVCVFSPLAVGKMSPAFSSWCKT
uniref:Uncharacterized protein n=1 Tax=Anguilla anguilla TaxID=7936 RepID=A0A0E9PSZ7_ANGAN